MGSNLRAFFFQIYRAGNPQTSTLSVQLDFKRILFRKINSTEAKSALIKTTQVEYSLYFKNYYQILNKNVTYKRLYILISTLDVSTYLDIEWEEEETEKCEVSFKKQCETLNKTVSKNFTNFLDNFSSGATEAGHRAF